MTHARGKISITKVCTEHTYRWVPFSPKDEEETKKGGMPKEFSDFYDSLLNVAKIARIDVSKNPPYWEVMVRYECDVKPL